MADKTNFDKINEYYQENFDNVFARTEKALSGNRENNYKILGWESRDAQYKRFSILAKNINLNHKKLLDVGSGLGDLYHFLTQGLHWSVDYVGTDILPNMVKIAKEQADQIQLPPGVNAVCRFLNTDIFDANSENLKNDKFDVVYTSGIFNLNLGNNKTFLKSSFERLAVIADEYFVCSLLSDTSKNKEDAYYYYNSEIIEKSMIDVKKMYPSSEYTIVDGYLPNDMTVIWKKSPDSGTQTP